MWARVATYAIAAERMDEATQAFEGAVDELRETRGLQRAYFLVDREGGKALTVTVWDSEQALRESEQAAERVRASATSTAGGEVTSVGRYEVVLQERFE